MNQFHAKWPEVPPTISNLDAANGKGNLKSRWKWFRKMAVGKIVLILSLLFPAIGFAQQYSIDWYKTAGGGGTSANGQYSLSGTIGQHDAGGPMTGGNYSLTGGFWSLISVVQTPGLPNLTISFVGPNSVVVSWPNTGSYTLQTNNNLNSSSWLGYSGTINTSNGTNSVTITPPTGNLFFRLSSP